MNSRHVEKGKLNQGEPFFYGLFTSRNKVHQKSKKKNPKAGDTCGRLTDAETKTEGKTVLFIHEGKYSRNSRVTRHRRQNQRN